MIELSLPFPSVWRWRRDVHFSHWPSMTSRVNIFRWGDQTCSLWASGRCFVAYQCNFLIWFNFFRGFTFNRHGDLPGLRRNPLKSCKSERPALSTLRANHPSISTYDLIAGSGILKIVISFRVIAPVQAWASLMFLACLTRDGCFPEQDRCLPYNQATFWPPGFIEQHYSKQL